MNPVEQPDQKQSNRNIEIVLPDEEEISFQSRSENYCICLVDIVNSTKIAARLTDPQIRNYYHIFLNTMAAIVRGHRAKIIKNIGDSLIYYFPATYDSTTLTGFKDVLDCGVTMISAHATINHKLAEEKLPTLDYRISGDYGRVEIAKSATAIREDFFGPTVNMCAKINAKAPINSMVIGADLCHILKSFTLIVKEYHFTGIDEYSAGLKHAYPVYLVAPRRDQQWGIKNGYASIGSTISYSPTVTVQKTKSTNIMLVEDETDLAYTYEKMLKEEGWNVNVFTDSEKALSHFAALQSYIFDLVILDIRMPKLNGLQLFYRLRSIVPEIKIQFITGLDAVQELTSILPGMISENVIKKPVETNEFISQIRKMLNS